MSTISREMAETIDRIRKRESEMSRGDRRSEDEIEADLKRALRDLRARQVIHSDDAGLRGSYQTILSALRFFEAHFGTEGYALKVNDRSQYVILLPGEVGITNRRHTLKRDETLVILMLRVLWQERGQTGDLDELGRVSLDSETLMDRSVLLAGPEFPTYTRLKEVLIGLRRRGLVRFTDEDEDREEQIIGFQVTAAINDIVDATYANDVSAFLEARRDGRAKEGADVMAFIEERRATVPASIEEARPKDAPPGQAGEESAGNPAEESADV